jgi:hypothetical protein
MLIYANGDSFTAGIELAADMLPGFPGNRSDAPIHKDSEKNFKWLDDVYINHQDLITPYLTESRRRAYPQKIGKALNCKVVNNSQGGASMDGIARTSILDLINLKKNYNDIVAVIGTTQTSRIDLPVELSQWQSVQVGYKFPPYIPVVVEKYYVKTYSNYHALTNYYKNLIYIQDFCKVNDIRLVFVNLMNDQPTIPEDNVQEANKVTQLKNYVKKYDFDMPTIAHTMQGDIFAPCGHFTEIVHTKLAEEIVKTL